jgi:iron(III) transport system substrate-binding protein
LRWGGGAALALVLLAACGREPEVVVYTSTDEEVARPVLERFERETGIRVRAKFDTEATKTTGLATVLRNERSRPRADVFWSNEQVALVELAHEGVLEPIPEAVLGAWPERWRSADGLWAAVAGRARVIVYAPDRVAEPPRLWTDLLDPAWRGRIAMADPRFGTTRGHLGAMKAYWDANAMPGYYEAWVEGLVENEPKVLTSGNAGVVDAVARGEADIGLTDTDDVLAAQARGLKVAMVQPRHARDPGRAGGGTFLVPNTVAIVAGGPNPERAAAFVAFMLTEATERQLAAMPSRHAPVVFAPRDGDLVVEDPLRVDAADAARCAASAVDMFMAARREADRAPPAPRRPEPPEHEDEP